MIFLTVGVQLPFDRLVRAVDRWAESVGRTDVVAQCGRSSYTPTRLAVRHTIPPVEYQEIVEAAELVIAHAGMGSIITALELGRPIVVMPRRSELGEHRNDHQFATARRLAEQKLVAVAFDDEHLTAHLNDPAKWVGGRRIARTASEPLLERLRTFVHESPTASP